MSLNYQDVQELLKLLDESPYNELTVQTGAFTLELQRSSDGKSWQQNSTLAAKPQVLKTNNTDTKVTMTEPAASQSGLLEVRAPMVGTWYRAPTPGAEPFIEVGSKVGTNSIIGIIEVMKLMSSIPALQHGTVVEILAQDACLVQKGQLLLRVKPE